MKCLGFEIFEAAANAHRECQGFKLRLRILYDRLDRWGTLTGLSDDQSSSTRYESQLKQNGPLVVAALSQLGLVLKDLRTTELRHELLGGQKVASENPGVGNATVQLEPKASDIADREVRAVISGELSIAFAQTVAIQNESAWKRPKASHRAVAACRRVASEPKRFRWVLRDGKKFEKGLVHIANLIAYLEQMLSQDQMGFLVKSAEDFKLMMLQLTANVDEMRALLLAGQKLRDPDMDQSAPATLDGATLVGTGDSAGALTAEVTLGMPASSRPTAFWEAATRFSIDVNEASTGGVSSNKIAQSIINDLVLGQALDRSRTIAKIGNGNPVWVEWRSFEVEVWTTEDGLTNRRIPHETVRRIEDLVALLHIPEKPAEFCVPHCLGYFQDNRNQRFGLVFEPPPGTENWPPRSLLSCFGAQSVGLQTKIRIAQELSQWLLYLQAVNWLHKGIRSASVLFFGDADAKWPGRPMVSGFDYSRIVHDGTTPSPAVDDVERAMYTHPDYIGQQRENGFKKTYDMYSVGIILIEIALWRPINHIFGFSLPDLNTKLAGGQAISGADRGSGNIASQPMPESRTDKHLPQATLGQAMSFRSQLLEGPVLQRVEENMGNAYGKATRVCIEGMVGLGLTDDQDQKDVSVAALIQQSFIDEVVDVLKGISV